MKMLSCFEITDATLETQETREQIEARVGWDKQEAQDLRHRKENAEPLGNSTLRNHRHVRLGFCPVVTQRTGLAKFETRLAWIRPMPVMCSRCNYVVFRRPT